ncbi:hypothetical protein COW53_05935, partial [bacterium CG17_big_fil_post_rev_8_21_14_2_50_64_8]
MKPDLYSARTAARDLAEVDLLVRVLREDGGRLVPAGAEDLEEAAGGFAGAALDSRTLEGTELFVALPGERADGRRFLDQALARGHWVLAGLEAGWDDAEDLAGMPAAPGSGVLVCADGIAGFTRLAVCNRSRWGGTVIGVTGTNGKTTCKDFCAAMLGGRDPVCFTRGNHNNRLGVPLTLLQLAPHHEFAVIEMGASAVGHIGTLADLARPHIGVITNAGSAHLAEFGSLEGVISGKGELLDVLPATGTAILNADSPGFSDWFARARCPVVSWGSGDGDCRWSWRAVPGRGWETEIDGESWLTPLPGRHNGANLTAALLAARAAGLSDAEARRGLEGFAGSAHRGLLLDWEGRLLLDDCYNANPVSMLAAAAALRDLAVNGGGIAIVGGMGELGADSLTLHRETGARLAELGLGALVAVGSGGEALGRGFDAQGGEAHYCADHAGAAQWIRTMTRPGDVILLKGSRSEALEK